MWFIPKALPMVMTEVNPLFLSESKRSSVRDLILNGDSTAVKKAMRSSMNSLLGFSSSSFRSTNFLKFTRNSTGSASMLFCSLSTGSVTSIMLTFFSFSSLEKSHPKEAFISLFRKSELSEGVIIMPLSPDLATS
ncbi:Uncharacterised protein [uncultured archaeon]|nr:Uncharacterised protein [uncultured archaeon]